MCIRDRYIDHCVISNVFESIITGVNDKLYVRESVSGSITDKVLTLGSGSYTPASLATVVATALNTLSGTFTCTVATTGNKLQTSNLFTLPDYAEILTKTQLNEKSISPAWSGTGADALNNDTQDACAVVGLMSAASGGIYSSQPLVSQFVSLQPYRTLLLHSHIGAPKSI